MPEFCCHICGGPHSSLIHQGGKPELATLLEDVSQEVEKWEPSARVPRDKGEEEMKIYLSVDIETDGLVAGRNNMISLGCAAIDMDNGKIVGKFKANLSLVPDLVPDFDTMEWWKGFPEAYESARVNAVSPSFAIGKFVEWVERVKTKDSLIFAWKPSFDCAFLRYYIHRFHPKGTELITSEPYGRHGFGLDQRTVAAIALKQAYRDTKLSALPDSLRLDEKSNVIAQHSHDALEDAVEQAAIFYNCVRRLGVEL